ncbi:MAG TPA: BamA/TamA family outer membrane protein, partial [Croceibacterium sp.]|nr:BamA/TamA family outer membrane protein [Croceibacterium sp.]
MKTRLLAACAVSVALVCNPAAAQENPVPPTLDELIPESAVSDPEGWAQQGVPQTDAAEDEETLPDIDPASAPDDIPGLDIPWPEDTELSEIAPLEPEDDIEFADFSDAFPQVQMGDEEKISNELVLVFPSERSLFPHHDEFIDRFKALSTIESLDADDNPARLAAQARADQELLERMLRIYGYYDATVFRSVGGIAPGEDEARGRATVRFDIVPGTQYTFGQIDLGDLDAAPDYQMLRDTFEVQTGDPLLSDKLVEERYDLDQALGENGYPFAAIYEPDLLVDHEREEGDLTMLVAPGGKYRFGAVTSNMPDFMSGEHLADIARFDPGDVYQRSLEMDLRSAVLATGLASSVTMKPVEVTPPTATEPGTVDIAVEMTPAKLRTIAGRVGYGTGEGFKVEGSWEHRNMFPPEGMVRARGILGTSEQLAGVTFRKNNFGGRDKILTLDAFASTIDYKAYDARTVSLVGSYERVSTILFQKKLSYSIGFEAVATGERERDANGVLGPRQTFFVGALPGFAQLDTSDDLLDPTKGWRLGARLSPEVSRSNGVQSFYLRAQVDASYYRTFGENVVMAGRLRFASIPGTSIANIAPSRRLYAGGGGSVR